MHESVGRVRTTSWPSPLCSLCSLRIVLNIRGSPTGSLNRLLQQPDVNDSETPVGRQSELDHASDFVDRSFAVVPSVEHTPVGEELEPIDRQLPLIRHQAKSINLGTPVLNVARLAVTHYVVVVWNDIPFHWAPNRDRKGSTSDMTESCGTVSPRRKRLSPWPTGPDVP